MADEIAFGSEMRGYRRDDVDRAFGDLKRDLVKAMAERTEANKEVKRLLAINDDLQAELDEAGSPTYSGLGTKLESTLRVAEEQATKLIAQADMDADAVRLGAQAEADRLTRESTATAERLVAEAMAITGGSDE